MMLKMIYRNLVHKPLHALLSVALLMLSVAIISLLLVTGSQVTQKLDKDLEGIDMVVGAKGSPLQLVLSAVYHVDAPTGNISKAEADKLARNPMIAQAIPLAYGDSYKGYRILGTSQDFYALYNLQTAEGHLPRKSMEVVAGAAIAAKLQLKQGQQFFSTHGEDSRGHVHAHVPYIICGILAPKGNVTDQLLLTNLESVWEVHQETDEHTGTAHPEPDKTTQDMHNHDHDEAADAHDHQEAAHDHAHDKPENAIADTAINHQDAAGKQVDNTTGQDITAMLIKFRSPMGIMMLPRMINENTTMQAAVPALEINRLVNLMGIGITTLQGVALAIMLIAGLSVFVSLYNRLKERTYEHAMIRTMGGTRSQIFLMLLSEGLLLALAGFMAGIALCRLGIWLLNKVAAADFHFTFSYGWVRSETWLLLITLLIGIFAALIPAVKARQLNIAKTLSDA